VNEQDLLRLTIRQLCLANSFNSNERKASMFIPEIFLDDTVSPTFRQQFTGTFHTSDTWGNGNLELHVNEKGVLSGHFTVEDIRFALKGCVSHLGHAFGFLLEPDGSIPVAMLRIKVVDDTLSLESYVPELTKLLDESNPEVVSFTRVAKNNNATAMLEELLINA
jgi:hypothetical protein